MKDGRTPLPRLALLAAALSLLALVGTPAAHACSCADDSPWPFPADGATDVPLNGVVWFLYEASAPRTLALVDEATGATVDSTTVWIESRGRQGYAVLTPDQALSPDTLYSVSDGDRTTAFTTGTETDITPPDVPRIADRSTIASPEFLEVACGIVQSSSCGTAAFVVLDLMSPSEDVLTEVQVIPDSDEGLVMTAFSMDDTVYAGEGACLSNMSRLTLETGGEVQIRAVDRAGLTSPWTEPMDFTLDWPQDAVCPGDTGDVPDEARCGCAAGPSGGAWGIGLALVLAGWRREQA